METEKPKIPNLSKLDDHSLAILEKRLKTESGSRLRRSGIGNKEKGVPAVPDISGLDVEQLVRLERAMKMERCYRRMTPERIDVTRVSEDEWKDVFECPDEMRQPDPSENKGGNIDFPFLPAEYFRHARVSLRKKMMRSSSDRREVLESFIANAVTDNVLMIQAMRLWLDKIYLSGPGINFQDFFISQFGTINAIKERKEKHVTALFEVLHRMENLPGITIDKVAQLNLAGANQLVNNESGIHKSPAVAGKEA